MRCLKLTLEYDGTGFCGFQKQTGSGLRTVQGVMEGAIERLTGEKVRIIAAGRTDAGVHALGQVINFTTDSGIPADRFPDALNSVLPSDIVVKDAEEADPSFHARFSAWAKRYCYLILNKERSSAIWRNYCCHVPFSLDVNLMRQGAQFFVGRHDFLAFSAAGSNVKNTVRNVFSFRVLENGHWICFDVIADGFLYKMVRLMAGTLIEVGRGKLPPSRIKEILECGQRGQGGSTAQPQGLYLVRVYYLNDTDLLDQDQLQILPLDLTFS